MKLKLNKDSQRSLELIQHISMESKDSVRNVVKAFLFHAIIQFLKKEPIHFPYIGEMKITYSGDKFVSEGKRADLDIEFIPDENLSRLVGKAIDGDSDELIQLVQSQISEKIGEYLEL